MTPAIGRSDEVASILPGKPRIRVGAMLALLAALPLAGLVIFAGLQFSAIADGQQRLSDIEGASENLVTLIEIETALDSEIYWTEASSATQTFGIPASMMEPLVGFDIDVELPAAQERVDELLMAYGDVELLTAVEQARANPNRRTEAQSALARASADQIPERIRQAGEELQTNSAGMADAEDLAHRAEVLDEANQLRSAFSTSLGSFLLLKVGGGDDATQASIEATGALANYELLYEELETSIRSGDPAATALGEVRSDPDVAAILDSASDATSNFDTMSLPEPSFSNPQTLIDLANTFRSATTAADRHLDLVDLAADDLSAELQNIRSREQRHARGLLTITAAIFIATLVALAAATRAIVAPIRRLGAAAESLGNGAVDGPLELSGPVEIQAATLTLNQAAANMQRAEAQAHALADGRLEDASFADAASGALGHSLDTAVRRLKDSMTEREQFRQRLSHEAAHDGLTGIPNRSASITSLENALRRSESSGAKLAVLFIDLDGFKRINDVHGHEAGDHLLIRVAQRLLASCRPSDRVGRLGGDEFLVVAEPVESLDAARQAAERIRKAACAAVQYRGITLHPSLSIGVAVADGSLEADEVIREADYAVYEAKKAGRNQTHCFDDVLRARLRHEADLETSISTGLTNDEFSLHFQPILRSSDNSVAKFEALLRWSRPGVGAISPDEYVPFAERSDLILEIDRWVINEGVRHLAAFASRPGLEDIAIAVNVSGRHLGRGDLYRHVKSVLDRWNVEPSRLTIEVTESALLEDLGAAAETLQALRQLGIRVAIDDFGTGYTSLTHLRYLPADILKIDKSFVRNLDRLDELSLVRLVTEIGHLLGMEITVEGVETAAQRDQLHELGVDSLQGFLFGRPQSFELEPSESADSLGEPAEVVS